MSRLYVQASGVLDKLNSQGGLKTLVFNKNTPGNKRKLYALVCETLKYKGVLDDVLKRCKLLKRLQAAYRPNFLYVMLFDLIIGRGIEGGGKVKRELRKHEAALKNALASLLKEKNATKVQDLLPDSIKNSIAMPRYARVNTLSGASSDQVIQAFEAEAVQQTRGTDPGEDPQGPGRKGRRRGRQEVVVPKKDGHIPHLLVFPPGYDLHDHPMVCDGRLILQDKSSCFPAYVLATALGYGRTVAESSEARVDVVDACAAPGNKTSQVAAFLNQMQRAAPEAQNSVFAFDISPKRIKVLQERMSQANASNVTAVRQSFLEVDPHGEAYKGVKGILLDPSCSGSGMNQRLDHLMDGENGGDSVERLNNLAEFQLKALKHALSFPHVSHVVYSTCSIHNVENEHVVHDALSSKVGKGFRLMKALPTWHRRGRSIEGKMAPDDADRLVRCLATAKDATNGFFVACFERKRPEVDPLELEKRQQRNAKRRAKKRKNKGKKRKSVDVETKNNNAAGNKREKLN